MLIYFVNVDKIRTKQELELLENKFSLDLLTYKTNLEEFTTELENLKAEVSNIFKVGWFYQIC